MSKKGNGFLVCGLCGKGFGASLGAAGMLTIHYTRKHWSEDL